MFVFCSYNMMAWAGVMIGVSFLLGFAVRGVVSRLMKKKAPDKVYIHTDKGGEVVHTVTRKRRIIHTRPMPDLIYKRENNETSETKKPT